MKIGHKPYLIFLVVAAFFLQSCSDEVVVPNTRGVYMLMDTSGTYTKELKQAQRVINYILSQLGPGDSFAVARVDTGSFSEKDIVAKVTFQDRPSMTNQQKRVFREKIDKFVKVVKGSAYTDITGGILQGIEFLNEAETGHNTILIFSDLKEELRKGYKRDIPLSLNRYSVVALNVTKLSSDQTNPEKYYERLNYWKGVVTERGGTWRKIDDIKRPETILRKK